jgi:hypothetical protein
LKSQFDMGKRIAAARPPVNGSMKGDSAARSGPPLAAPGVRLIGRDRHRLDDRHRIGRKAPVQTAQRRPLSFGGVDDRLRGPTVFRASSSCGAAIDRNAATMIGTSDRGSATVSTPFLNVAVALSRSIPRGRPMRRSKRP